jgi:methylmalonyl-CoA mutase
MPNDRSPSPEHLLGEFSPPPPGAWKAAAEALLKGAPFDKKMFSRTHEGIVLHPVYDRTGTNGTASTAVPGTPGEFPYHRGALHLGDAPGPWLIAQEITYPTYEEFNAALRHDLERGQNAVFMPLDRASRFGEDPDVAPPDTVGSGGASVASIAGFGKALQGIDISTLPLFVEAGCAGPQYLAIAVAHAKRARLPASVLKGCVGSDPLGILAAEGRLPFATDVLYDEMAVAAEWAEKNAPCIRTLAVSTRPYADGGASAVEEVACALATGAAYLYALIARGVSPEVAASQIWFSFSLGPQFFMEIAKLRAARLAWAHVAGAFGVPQAQCAMHIHARTSRYDMSTVDPYVNMLRSTTEAMSGAIGGCQSMHVAPFDDVLRQPDEFSRRIARNVQAILQAESYLHRVADPAGGSWLVESITSEIATAAWKLFQEIEAAGGMQKALESGLVQKRIAATAADRTGALGQRRDVMVGVTTYANTGEKPLESRPEDLETIRARRAETLRMLRAMPERAEETAVKERLSRIMETGRDSIMNALIDAAAQGATVGEMGRAWRARRAGDAVQGTPVPAMRRAAPYEALRAASHAYERSNGKPPLVFLATMGPLSQHKVRADFSADFIAAAGCIARTGTGYATVEEAVDAALASGARAVVLCSPDETYPALVQPFCALMKQRMPDAAIILAGYPQEHIDAFRSAGVHEFLHIRADVVATMQRIMVRMGVQA